MADAQDKGKAAEAQAEAPQAKRSQSYPKARLIGEAEAYFGVPHYVVAGALSDVEEGANVSLTDAKKRIASFLGN